MREGTTAGEARSVCSTARETAGGGGLFEEPSGGQRRICTAAGGTAAGDGGRVEEHAEEGAKRFRSAAGGGGSVAAPSQVSPTQPPPPPPLLPFPPAPTPSRGAIGEVVTAAVSAGVTAAVTAFQQGLQQGQQHVSSKGGAAESRVRLPPTVRFGEEVSTMLAEVQQQQRGQQRKTSRSGKRLCFEFSKEGRCSRGNGCRFQHGI